MSEYWVKRYIVRRGIDKMVIDISEAQAVAYVAGEFQFVVDNLEDAIVRVYRMRRHWCRSMEDLELYYGVAITYVGRELRRDHKPMPKWAQAWMELKNILKEVIPRERKKRTKHNKAGSRKRGSQDVPKQRGGSGR